MPTLEKPGNIPWHPQTLHQHSQPQQRGAHHQRLNASFAAALEQRTATLACQGVLVDALVRQIEYLLLEDLLLTLHSKHALLEDKLVVVVHLEQFEDGFSKRERVLNRFGFDLEVLSKTVTFEHTYIDAPDDMVEDVVEEVADMCGEHD
jgi:hypothetical protein